MMRSEQEWLRNLPFTPVNSRKLCCHSFQRSLGLKKTIFSKYQQGDGAENTESVIDHLQNQLQSLDLLLAATILKIGAAQSGSSPGVLIGSNFNSPEIVIEMLQKMTAHTDEIGILIKNLRDHENMQQKEREMNLQSYKNMAIKGILLASGVIVGFFIAKTLRGGGGKSSI